MWVMATIVGGIALWQAVYSACEVYCDTLQQRRDDAIRAEEHELRDGTQARVRNLKWKEREVEVLDRLKARLQEERTEAKDLADEEMRDLRDEVIELRAQVADHQCSDSRFA